MEADCRHLCAYEFIASKPFAVGHAFRTEHTDRCVGVRESNTSTSSQSLEMERFGSHCSDQASRNCRNSNFDDAPGRGKNTRLGTDIRWRGFWYWGFIHVSQFEWGNLAGRYIWPYREIHGDLHFAWNIFFRFRTLIFIEDPSWTSFSFFFLLRPSALLDFPQPAFKAETFAVNLLELGLLEPDKPKTNASSGPPSERIKSIDAGSKGWITSALSSIGDFTHGTKNRKRREGESIRSLAEPI